MDPNAVSDARRRRKVTSICEKESTLQSRYISGGTSLNTFRVNFGDCLMSNYAVAKSWALLDIVCIWSE